MRNRPLLSVCLMVLCVMTTCIIWGGPKFIKELRPSQLEIHTVESNRVTFCGEIYRQEQKENCQMFYLKKNSIYSNVNNYKFQESKIIIYSNSKEKLHIGNKIKGQGEVSFFDEARNPGNFDQKFYYQKQGIHGKIWAEADDVDIVDERTDRLRDRLETLRARWKAMLIKEMGEEDGAILAAILLGEKSEMDPETKELYQVNGIGHILAISGLHLSFAGLGVYRIFRRFTGSYKVGGVIGGIVLFLYVAMIGMTVSVIRAWVMFLFRIGADMTGRHYDMPTALLVAAVIALGHNPLYLYDGGFWLSFGAVFAICVASAEKVNRAAFVINSVLCPVILYNFYELPVYSMLLNVIVLPLMSVLLSCGLTGSAVSMAGVVPKEWMFWICRKILKVYKSICLIMIKVPMARLVAGRPDKRRIFLYYLFLCLAFLVVKHLSGENKEGKKHSGKKKILKIYLSGIFLYTIGLLILISGPFTRTGIEITMLDVGQGDCICIEGPGHLNYMIDGGSSDVKNVGKYRIEPFLKSRGIGRLDYVFVSHGDLDHMSGIEEMLMRQDMGVKISNLVVPVKIYWDEKIQNLVETAKKCGITVQIMECGSWIKNRRMRLTCLGPESTSEIQAGNTASMILHLQYEGFDMLFTGDVEQQGEELLTEKLKQIKTEVTWEILKTAHHGSKNSTTEEFLNVVDPEYAWISAGRKNRYGHPHKETLDRLEENGAKIYSTQQNGAIGVTVKEKTMRIHGRNG